MYNLKVYNYKLGQQIRIYDIPVRTDIVRVKDEKEKEQETEEEEIVDYLWDTSNLDRLEEKLEREVEEKIKKCHSMEVSMSRTIQKIYEITRSNYWNYFVTLTFDPEKVNSFDYEEVVSKLSVWLNNVRKKYAPDLKYIIVPELHKSGRYHFHGLFANIGNLSLVDSGYLTENGQRIYNLGNYKLGFTTATKIVDLSRVCSYLTKYISKELVSTTSGKKRYWASRNLDELQVTEYLLTPEEINNLIIDNMDYIEYMKTTKNIMSERKTKYIELKYTN